MILGPSGTIDQDENRKGMGEHSTISTPQLVVFEPINGSERKVVVLHKDDQKKRHSIDSLVPKSVVRCWTAVESTGRSEVIHSWRAGRKTEKAGAVDKQKHSTARVAVDFHPLPPPRVHENTCCAVELDS
jgi:hypothetical protein